MLSISIGIYFIYCLLGIVTQRVLYADGVNYFLGLIQGNFVLYDATVNRYFVNMLQQLPIHIAYLLGIYDMGILKIIFGSTMFLQNIIGIGALYCISRWHNSFGIFRVSIAIYVFVNMLSEIFISNEIFLSYWIFSILFFYTYSRKYGKIDYVFLGCALVIFTRANDAAIFFGSVIGFSALIHLWNVQRKICLLILTVSWGTVLYTIYHILVVSVQTASQGYLMALFSLKLDCIVSLWGSLFFVYVYIRYSKENLPVKVIVYWLLLGIALVLFVTISGRWVLPEHEFGYRTHIGIIGASIYFMYIIMPYMARRIPIRKLEVNNFYIIISMMLLLQSMWQIGNCFYWAQYTEEFKNQIVSSNRVVLDIETFKHSRIAGRFEWPWTTSDLSIAVMDSYTINKIVTPRTDKHIFQVRKDGISLPCVEINAQRFNFDKIYEASVNREGD